MDSEKSDIKNGDLMVDTQKEIFSDLQHFVEATLIAVNTDGVKNENCIAEHDLSNNSSPDISDGNQPCSSKSIACTATAISGTSNGSALDYGDDGLRTRTSSDLGTSYNVVDLKTSIETNYGIKRGSGIDSETSILNSKNPSKIGTSDTLANENKHFNEISNLNDPDTIEKVESESRLYNNNRSKPNESQDILSLRDDIKGKRKNTADAYACKKRSKMKVRIRLKEKNLHKGKNEVLNETPAKSGRKSKVGSFHCKECDYTFRFLGAYNNHKKDGKCLFVCEYCGKSFTSRHYSNYKSHLKYHVKERPHKCNICGKTYIEAQTLKIHMRKHSGDRPYVCHHCGLQFYSSSNLLSHRNSAHSDSREIHKCDICDARLSTQGNLRVHKKVVHAVERPFTCEICGKSFKTQKSLEQVHAKVHSEDFPYKCEFIECGKMFKRSEGLADHMRRHNNDRNHFCDKCGKGFYSNKDLTLHTRTHTGEKPHRCQLCDYKCALAGNLRKHMKTHLQ